MTMRGIAPSGRVVFVAACCWLLTVPGAIAHEPTPTPTPIPSEPFFFGEIVVVDDEDDPSSGTTDLLDSETIRRSGAVTLGEALSLLPGVSMSVGGRAEQKIWVRGYEQSNVLVLVDGVPVSDPYYGDPDLEPQTTTGLDLGLEYAADEAAQVAGRRHVLPS